MRWRRRSARSVPKRTAWPRELKIYPACLPQDCWNGRSGSRTRGSQLFDWADGRLRRPAPFISPQCRRRRPTSSLVPPFARQVFRELLSGLGAVARSSAKSAAMSALCCECAVQPSLWHGDVTNQDVGNAPSCDITNAIIVLSRWRSTMDLRMAGDQHDRYINRANTRTAA